MNSSSIQAFCDLVQESILNHQFVKLTFSKSSKGAEDLKNVYVRMVNIKNEEKMSFTFRHVTNDKVKNYSIEEGVAYVLTLLTDYFLAASLFTTHQDVSLLISKKGKVTLVKNKATFVESEPEDHNREKRKRVVDNDAYLNLLGITDENGLVIPKMTDKYRQINKYLEVIESLIKDAELPKQVNIVDMGSGKGYLTFALYDFLKNKLRLDVRITGIELRTELVNVCRSVAKQCGFKQLFFESKRIEDFNDERIDILIALHACDTATDDAIQKGFSSNAALIICAPCCHKQIRQQVKGKTQQSPLLKYGIFKERQFEMVTDAMRGLIMEKHQYDTKIFEFISNEHTRKNVMLVGTKTSKNKDVSAIDSSLKALKGEFGIDFHYLEKIAN
jgi:hypothetical protein